MKKSILLSVLISLSAILNTVAQNPTQDLFIGTINQMTYVWDVNVAVSVTPAFGPYEGSDHYKLNYNKQNWYAGGEFNIDTWGWTPVDLRKYTHLQFAWKSTNGNAGTDLSFALSDTNSKYSKLISVIPSGNSPSYQLVSIPLNSFYDQDSLFDPALIRGIYFQVGGGQTETGEFYIDAVQLVDNSSITAGGSIAVNSPGNYDFGIVNQGSSSAPVTFTLSNLGSSTNITLTGTPKVAISGANASDFIIDETSTSSSIAAGANTSFTVTFAPSSPGNKSAILTIMNSYSYSGFVIYLSGSTGYAATIDLYSGTTNNMYNLYTQTPSVLTEAASGGCGGGSEYQIDYQATYYDAGWGFFNIDGFGTNPQNYSKHTHLKISYRWNGNISTSTGNGLYFILMDSSNKAGSFTKVATAATGFSGCVTEYISLSTFIGDSSLNVSAISNIFWMVQDFLNFADGFTGTGQGTFYIDDLQIVDLMDIKAAGTSISSTDSYDFGSTPVGTPTSAVTFDIENLGPPDLYLTGTPKIEISGANASDFIVDQSSISSPITEGGNTGFTVQFNPSGTGTRTAVLTIRNSYYVATIDLTGTGTLAPFAYIDVKAGTANVTNGGNVAFLSVPVGTSFDTTFTITNFGSLPLTLSGSPRIALSGNTTEFTIDSTVLISPIASGGTTTFKVTFNPSAAGTASPATITILNDDPNQSSYVINLTGVGIAPEINIKAGAISLASGGSFNFGNSNVGTATAATTFKIENLGTGNLTLSGTPKIAISGTNASDFSIVQTGLTSPVAASGNTMFTITFNPSATGARTATITIANDDSDEGSYVINLTGAGTAPEINIKAGATSLASGGSFDFGNSDVGTATAATTFTIENLGTGNLTLSGTPKIAISGTNASDFSIVQTGLTSPVAASGNTTFTITFNPSATGARTATITIANNDSDEGSYVIDLTGNGTIPTGLGSKYTLANLTVSPNPSSGIYIVSSEANIDGIIVTDYLGNNIITQTDNSTSDIQIDLTNYADGLYFLTITSENKRVIEKLIKK